MAVGWQGALAGTLSILAVGCASNQDAQGTHVISCRGEGVNYPSGRCGYDIGDVLPNFTLFGRADGIDSPRAAVSLADYYDPAGSRGLRYLLVNATTLWCPFCVEETKGLPGMKIGYGPRGVRFMTLLVQNVSGATATDADVDDFIRKYGLTTIVVTDPQGVSLLFFDLGAMPLNMIVDLRTMKIVAKIVGGGWSTVRATLDDELNRP